MKKTIILALISTLLMAISFLLMIFPSGSFPHNIMSNYIYFVIGGFWLIFQLAAIYMDFINYERHRKKFVEVGLLGWLLGGWHANARLWYIVTAFYPFLMLFLFDLVMFSNFSYFGAIFGFDVEFRLGSFENNLLILWGLSGAINFFTGLLATPPRKKKGYGKICERVMYNYFGKYQGKAFSVKALTNRIRDLKMNAEKRKYCKEHIHELLSNLVSDGKIDSVVKNDELFYLIPNEWGL